MTTIFSLVVEHDDDFDASDLQDAITNMLASSEIDGMGQADLALNGVYVR